jgi:hypothetical protein
MLTAGLGAYLWMTRGHHSKGELSRLLISRGVWLIVLEVPVLRLILLSQISFTRNPVMLMILWAIGLSMVALAGLIYLPMPALMGISIAIIALHNLLDPVSAQRFGRATWIWDILHQQTVFAFHGINFVTAYRAFGGNPDIVRWSRLSGGQAGTESAQVLLGQHDTTERRCAGDHEVLSSRCLRLLPSPGPPTRQAFRLSSDPRQFLFG